MQGWSGMLRSGVVSVWAHDGCAVSGQLWRAALWVMLSELKTWEATSELIAWWLFTLSYVQNGCWNNCNCKLHNAKCQLWTKLLPMLDNADRRWDCGERIWGKGLETRLHKVIMHIFLFFMGMSILTEVDWWGHRRVVCRVTRGLWRVSTSDEAFSQLRCLNI